jgi:hypothetical protein
MYFIYWHVIGDNIIKNDLWFPMITSRYKRGLQKKDYWKKKAWERPSRFPFLVYEGGYHYFA